MNHAYRPLIVVAVIVALIIGARFVMVPEDFGSHERGFMYGWHRKGNEQDWKDVKVKYRGREYCRECHPENFMLIMSAKHAIINCENCHGPAIDHPSDPPKLEKARQREHCLRCHAKLPYKHSGRSVITGIDPDKHNPDMLCVDCHNPHKPPFG